MVARELVARGHVVRGTTRRTEAASAIEAAGAEVVIGDPDRVATLAPALDHVSVAVVLLGGAVGDDVAELHGSRLEMLLLRMLDTTIRGIVYETSGATPAPVLAAGSSIVREACERSRIPYAFLGCDPVAAGYDKWCEQALSAIDRVLGG
jgi:hypothetical protein